MKNQIYKPYISVIVPVYNSEQYIAKCIDSIIAQSFTNWELILVNDGSTDRSNEICDNYSRIDNRIHVLHKENEGVSLARNRGLEKAEGDWICFIDSDDYIYNDYLASFIEHCVPNILCVQGYIIEYKNNIIVNNLEKYNNEKQGELYCQLENSFILNSPWCKLYNRDIIKKYNLKFDYHTSFGEDHIFTLNYIKHVDTIVYIEYAGYVNNRNLHNSLSRRLVPIDYLVYYIKIISGLMRDVSKKWNMPHLKFSRTLNMRLYNQSIQLLYTFFHLENSSYSEYSKIIKVLHETDVTGLGLGAYARFRLSLVLDTPLAVSYALVGLFAKIRKLYAD